jgi:DNA repair exonuclease SbcCD ATPase subunit
VPDLKAQDFAVRLGEAKLKFEQMQAATQKLETTVNASTVVRKPTKHTKQTRMTEEDIDNLYKELKESQRKRQQKTDLERNKRAHRGRTAKVAPAPVATPDDELAAIEADLKSAEDTVEQFKAMVDELRVRYIGVPEVTKWILTAEMELELQLDYLSQVEQNLATVPSPVDLNRLREVHAGLGLPRPPAKQPWRGGRRTPRRRNKKTRKSTFRRNRKH